MTELPPRDLALIALGANLGDPRAALRQARDVLADVGEVQASSWLYRTVPVGGPPAGGCVLLAADGKDRKLRVYCSQGCNRMFKAEKAPLNQVFQFYDGALLEPPAGNRLAQLIFDAPVGRFADSEFKFSDAGMQMQL